MPHLIENLFAFIAVDAVDGDEGVAAFMSDGTFMPMVGSDQARVESLRAIAQRIANGTGAHVNLVRFSVREVVDVIKPEDTTTH